MPHTFGWLLSETELDHNQRTISHGVDPATPTYLAILGAVLLRNIHVNTSRPDQNGRHLADDIFQDSWES